MRSESIYLWSEWQNKHSDHTYTMSKWSQTTIPYRDHTRTKALQTIESETINHAQIRINFENALFW